MQFISLCALVLSSVAAATDSTNQACEMARAQDPLLGAACQSLGDRATPIVSQVKSCTDQCQDDTCRQSCVMTTLGNSPDIGLPGNITEDATNCAKKCGQDTTCLSKCVPPASANPSSASPSASSPSSNDAVLPGSSSLSILLILASFASFYNL